MMVLPSRPASKRAVDAYQGPAERVAGEHAFEYARQFVQTDLPGGDAVQLSRLPVAGEVLPELAPDVPRGTRRGHAEQAHAANDERHHRAVEGDTAGIAADGDVAVRADQRQQAGEHAVADVVQRAAETCRVHRLAAEDELVAVEAFAGAQLTQRIEMIALAADRVHLVAGATEDVDRQLADPTAGTGDRDRAELGPLTIVLHAQQGQRGGETGGAQDHAFAQAQAGRQRNRPARVQSGVFREAAIAGLGQAAAGAQHAIAFPECRVGRSHHMAGDVDAAVEWIAAQDAALAGAGQRILVVDRGIRDLDQYFAR